MRNGIPLAIGTVYQMNSVHVQKNKTSDILPRFNLDIYDEGLMCNQIFTEHP